MDIVFFGTPEFVVPVLEKLTEAFNVVAVVSAPGSTTPIKKFADEHNITVLTPQQFNSVAIEQLKNFRPDFFVVAAYGKLIPQTILNIPKYAALNIHPSLLPKYRGPSPIQATILNGDTTTGVTIILMDAELDHGPIVKQEDFTLKGTETFEQLAEKLFTLGGHLITSVIEDYAEEKAKPIAQKNADATFTEHISRQNGYIDLDSPPLREKLDRMIRAYYPWPGVWSRQIVNGKWSVIKFLPQQKIQMEGKKPVTLKDFLNGYPELRSKILPILPISNSTN